MMFPLETIASLAALPGPVHLAIGVFDGVHCGHRAVIEAALDSARGGGTAVVVTFDPHPAAVLRPAETPLLLTSTRHKLRLFARLGAAHTLVVPFSRGFAATDPADFIGALAEACRPLGTICVGEHWAFGKGRKGDVALLLRLGGDLGFRTIAVPNVSAAGRLTSSTAIRAALQQGDLAGAAQMLGRNFSVLGRVIAGNRLGRTLGFPTANLRPESEQLPPNGVYAVRVDAGGAWRAGVANIGVRPTIEKSPAEVLLEAHVFDFDGDLYGADIEIEFVKWLRPERRFPSLDALKAQIAADAAVARATIE